MHRTRAWLELLRPANVVTALADVLAGAVIASGADTIAPAWLLASTACLYGGGVVLNDVFDRHLDAVERPERPIPSGRVTARGAATLGFVLIGLGVAAAARASRPAFMVAVAIAAMVILYDAWAKRGPAGPAVMGLCRGLNLLLGIAAVPAALAGHWPLALLAVIHILGVTTVSRGEVHGGTRGAVGLGLASMAGVICGLALVVSQRFNALALLMSAAFAGQVLPSFWSAWRRPDAGTIRLAVRAGILALLVLDAAIAAAHGARLVVVLILVLALAARALSRAFAVT